MTVETITVMYTCHGCGVVKAEVAVPLRDSAMDVVTWLQAVMSPPVALDHRRRSPICIAEKFDLMIPHDGRDIVGGPVKH